MPSGHATTGNASAQGKRRRRADAERSVVRILDAAVDALASDPEVSMAEIARRAGVFRADVPSTWHLSMLLALIHAASGELQTKRLPAAEIEAALVTTVLGALSATGGDRR